MKNRQTYKMLTYFSFLCPLNRIYLGEKGVIKRILTGNYFCMGWIGDLLYMDKRFNEAMAKQGFMNTQARNKEEN
ncbi:MAG: hypothetical protein LBT91_00820 [Bifidobacteriaceae bacterium]|jgi:hypothetical protein|nr:hypothetical protein [Bifidobacteriaceae bacterium]